MKFRATRINATKVPNASLTQIRAAERQLKSRFKGWLSYPEMFNIERELLKKIRDESEEVRFILQTNNSYLQRLPWHNWHIFNEYHNAELGLYLPVGNNQTHIPRDTVKVLAVFGKTERVGTNTKLRTEEDLKALQKHLATNSNAKLVSLEEPTLEELCEAIETESPQILFFAGHTSSEDYNSVGIIELNQNETITIDDIAPEIRDAVNRGLQLAIFNSCEGLGIAKQLESWQIPNIIVMREPVEDEVAQKFLQRFLEAFAAGKSLSLAMRKAREKINRLETKFPGATGLPIILQNPARPPLTWNSLGGKTINRRQNINQQNINQEKKEELDSISWLTTQINLADINSNAKTHPINESNLLGQRYQLVERLRKTVFCETYMARDIQLPGNPRCIVKKLQIQSNEDFVLETARRLFHNEAKVLHKLSDCRLIPRLLANLEVKEEFYLVQEFIEGQDLSQSEITAEGKMSEAKVRELLKEVLNILAFVHHNQVIHRDIKPSNLIRRTCDRKIVLIDFGSVKEIANMTFSKVQDKTLTVAIGTPGYMAAEQQRGDPRFSSDIYGLGITGIQALTGLHPDQIPRDLETGEINWRDRAPECSSELANLLDKMVRNNFKERYQNVNEVLYDLKQLELSSLPKTKPLKIISSSETTTNKPDIAKIIAAALMSIAILIGLLMIFKVRLTNFDPVDNITPESTEDSYLNN